ncbi:hypothetical protein [Xenorhabdus hominickii]|uniref:Lipoprotein n=1 Tax=Xenorhabdus hominickii TaxID=351679 RepID=A0A2G0Q9Z0_XENHO|nr:hypothetical protein [Xenorhabdus hominickii]AOM40993.1 hypothetical protein A9255_10630 [Xenorhabdus hominickii]PHM56031.1 hypothetical protein Xhom_01496 [Xenorhabdus hominickii]
MKNHFFIIGFLFVSGCDGLYKNKEINEAKKLYDVYKVEVKTHCDLSLLNIEPEFKWSDNLYVLNGYNCPDGKIYFLKEEFTKDTIPVFSK